MKKLAIIYDSFCGRNKKTVESWEHCFFLPLQFEIDGKLYKVGCEKDNKELMKTINNSNQVKTSMPSPADIIEVFDKTSKEYENVIYLSISSSLSGTYKVAKAIAQDYKNVHVFESILVGYGFEQLGKSLIKMSNEKKINDVLKFTKKYLENVPITFVVPKDVEAFIKSGRLGKTIGNLLQKIKSIPIVSFEDNKKLHKKGLKRSGEKAIKFVVKKIIEIQNQKGDNFKFLITHVLDETFSLKAKTMLEEQGKKVRYEISNALIMSNTGDGAFSIGLYEEINH